LIYDHAALDGEIPEEFFKNPKPSTPTRSTGSGIGGGNTTTAVRSGGSGVGGSASTDDAKKVVLKVFVKDDNTYKTLAITSQTTTRDALAMVRQVNRRLC
jgi:hypothetical protein